MREQGQPAAELARGAQDGCKKVAEGAGSEVGLETVSDLDQNSDLDRSIDRKFWAAVGMYAVLAALVWFTMSADKVLVLGRPVEMRWIPLFVIGVMALRTVLVRHAERIRRGSSGAGE